MQINPKIVKKQFEKSFNKYGENALVQKHMAEILVKSLNKTDFDTILELGSGTGFLTENVVKTLKFKKYMANDLVEKSKKYLDRILHEYDFIVGNAQKIKLNSRVDLIVSNAMFQWFKNLDVVVEHCKNMLNPKGILAFSTFSPDNFKEIKSLTGLSLDYKTVDEIKKILSKDYEILNIKEFEKVLKFNSPLELLAHMKNTGVNSLNGSKWTFKEVKDFCEKYSETYPENTLTYSPIIVVARLK